MSWGGPIKLWAILIDFRFFAEENKKKKEKTKTQHI